MKRIVQAGKFKAECLKIMDKCKKTKRSIIITKHNRPVVKLTPIEEDKTSHYLGK